LGWGKKIVRNMEKTILITNVGTAVRYLYGSVLEIRISVSLAITNGNNYKKMQKLVNCLNAKEKNIVHLK
jgi:hypothetical protein